MARKNVKIGEDAYRELVVFIAELTQKRGERVLVDEAIITAIQRARECEERGV